MSIADMVYKQVQLLPEPLAREVLEFVGYLREGRDCAQCCDLTAAEAERTKAVSANSHPDFWVKR